MALKKIKRFPAYLKNNIWRFFKWFLLREGMVITLLLAILANLISSHIQENIKRQRHLELLEYEIKMQALMGQSLNEEFDEQKFLFTKILLSDDIYLATLNLGYLSSVDPETNVLLSAYYSVLPIYNYQLQTFYQHIDDSFKKWNDCAFHLNYIKEQSGCIEEQRIYEKTREFYSKEIIILWSELTEDMFKPLSKRFNPTQDRLNSKFLVFFMGNESMPFLNPPLLDIPKI